MFRDCSVYPEDVSEGDIRRNKRLSLIDHLVCAYYYFRIHALLLPPFFHR